MDVLGWALFALGGLLLFFFAFVGLDTGFGNVANLAGTFTGAASLISGAVFVAGSRVEKAINSLSKARPMKSSGIEDNENDGSIEVGDEQEKNNLMWGWVVVVIFLLGMLVLGATLQGAR